MSRRADPKANTVVRSAAGLSMTRPAIVVDTKVVVAGLLAAVFAFVVSEAAAG